MNGFWVGWIAGLGGFVLFWIVHVIWFRFFSPKDRLATLRRLLLVFLPLVVLGTALGTFLFVPGRDLVQLTLSGTEQRLLASSIFFAAYFGFLSFYAAIEHSVRIRVILELYRSPKGELTLKELMSIYRPEEGTQHRLDQMTAGGYLLHAQNHFQLTKKGRVFARLVLASKRFFKIGIGG